MSTRPPSIVALTYLSACCLLALPLLGCSDNECGAGYERVGAMCVAQMGDAGVESCNDDDDDGDGRIDETDPSAGSACGTQVGACTIGVLTCEGGELACDGAMGADDICNGIDDDCDGRVDESLSTTFYLDSDMDGFGNDQAICEACEAGLCPSDGPWVAVGGDCDDTCGSCFIGGTEICDTYDNDCDGAVDEDVVHIAYVDGDGDGFGAGEGVPMCLGAGSVPPPGYALQGGDCADGDRRANPDARELFTTQVRGVVDVSVDFDFDCDGREERLHLPCPSCLNGACWQHVEEPRRAGDPACGARSRARRSDVLNLPGRSPICVESETYEDIAVGCR